MTDLANQLDSLMSDFKASLPGIEDRLQALDQTLLAADLYVREQLTRILQAHEDRTDDAIALLGELRAAMLRPTRVPAIEDRYDEDRFGRKRTGQDLLRDLQKAG